MILVTGATGTVGRALVETLGSQSLRLATRDPGRVQGAHEAVRFDVEAPETHAQALEGIGAVFLMRPPAIARAAAFDPLVAALARARVRRVVFLSVRGAGANPLLPHHGIERRIEKAGLTHTFLRANDFMQNFATTHGRAIRESGEIRLPAGRGRTSYVDARDVADVAAHELLARDAQSRAPTLTGPEAFDLEAVARLIGEASGRPIAYRPPSLPRFLRERIADGDPPALALVMSGIYTVQRLGLASAVTDDVATCLGRPPRRFADFARDHAAVWRAPHG